MNGPITAEALDNLYLLPGMVAAMREAAARDRPGWAAQVDAASRLVDDALPDDASRTPWAEIPLWIRLQTLDVLLRWGRGRISTCQHLPGPQHPTPVAIALWRPDSSRALPAPPPCTGSPGRPTRPATSAGRSRPA